MKLVNDFLVNRKVTINVNGVVGKVRKTSNVGLPQGSALSPTLFRIYLMDFLTELQSPDITLLKFADDGTGKITGKTTKQCLETMKLVSKAVESWVKKWRMCINCKPDKTEVICFATTEKDRSNIPKTFQLCGREIRVYTKSGLIGKFKNS